MSKTKKQNNFSGKIKCKNGISLRSDIGFTLERQTGGRVYPFMQLLITVLASASAIFMAISFLSSELPWISPEPIILTIILASSAVMLLNQQNKFFKGIGAAYLIINTVFILTKLSESVSGMIYTAYSYTKKAELSVPLFVGMVTDSSRRYVETFFIALTFLITLGISLACIYRTNFPILFLCTFPIFELGAFWGWEPATWTAAVMLICWITVLSLNLINHTTKNRASRNTFAIYKKKKIFYMTSENLKKRFFGYASSMVIILTVLIFLISGITAATVDSYRPEKINQLRKDISTGFQNFTMKLSDKINVSTEAFPGRGKMIGGTNGGRLGLYDEITFRGITALNINTETLDKPLYLRGYAAADYSENCWDPVKTEKSVQKEFENDGRTALDYGFIKTSGNIGHYSISVTPVNANKDLIYAPYQSNYSDCSNVKKQRFEGMASPKKPNDRYRLSYVLPEGSDWEEILDYAANKMPYAAGDVYSAYDEYVCGSSEFLSTPSDITPLLDHILNGAEISDVNQAAEYIRKYFDDNGFYYTLNPGITPADEDFVEYFLTEQKKGYCTYFASAGVMLMRRLGYPARYVEGYIVEPSQCSSSSGRITVTDRSAHAWCEVYIKGCGWYPIEFTPGFSNDNPNLTEAERIADKEKSGSSSLKAMESSSVSSSVQSSSKPASSSDTPSDTSKKESESSSSKSDTSTDVSDENSSASVAGAGTLSGGSSGSGSHRLSKTSVIYCSSAVIFVLFTVIAVVVRRKAQIEKLRSKMNSSDNRAAVLACYRHCLKYLSLIGISFEGNDTDTQQAIKIAKMLEETELSLKEPFIRLSETAVTAYMSDRNITDKDADDARKITDYCCSTIYSRLSAPKRFAAKWIHNLC